MIELPSTIYELLSVPVLFGLIWALYLERAKWFQALQDPDTKRLVTGVVAALIAAVVTAIGYIASEDQLQAADQWYQAALPLLSLFIKALTAHYATSELSHRFFNKLLVAYIDRLETNNRLLNSVDIAVVAEPEAASPAPAEEVPTFVGGDGAS